MNSSCPLVCSSTFLPIYLSVCLSLCMSVRLSVFCLSVFLSVYLSVCLQVLAKASSMGENQDRILNIIETVGTRGFLLLEPECRLILEGTVHLKAIVFQ